MCAVAACWVVSAIAFIIVRSAGALWDFDALLGFVTPWQYATGATAPPRFYGEQVCEEGLTNDWFRNLFWCVGTPLTPDFMGM